MLHRTLKFGSVVIIGFLALSSIAYATPKQAKFYQEAYPNAEKPKCIACHTVEKPKKEGNHELNDYGKKVKELAETPSAEEYKKAGEIPA